MVLSSLMRWSFFIAMKIKPQLLRHKKGLPSCATGTQNGKPCKTYRILFFKCWQRIPFSSIHQPWYPFCPILLPLHCLVYSSLHRKLYHPSVKKPLTAGLFLLISDYERTTFFLTFNAQQTYRYFTHTLSFIRSYFVYCLHSY